VTARATVAAPTARFIGIGLHSGLTSWIEIHPASAPGRGIIFRSHSSGKEVAASSTNVISTNRSTCLGADNIRVETVEHLLSALYSFGISDADIVFDGQELPIGDGSSLPFFKILNDAGLTNLDGERDLLTLDRAVVVTDGKGSVLTAVPSDHFWVTAILDYSSYPAIGTTSVSYADDHYWETIAPARTYGFHHELEALKSAGLGKGASIDNVVALQDDGAPDERTPLRLPDELVRHKILDLIGDLSLSQKTNKFGVVALRPGHTLNVQLSRALLGNGE
jgi:UDP-3-O-[3-hydroxymyristoyl] N-acetylglucosamine deacetylase